jgi:hypothetical protein
VLPGHGVLFLQWFCPEHRIAIPLEHFRLLSGSLHDILQHTTFVTRVLSSCGRSTIQGY